MVGWTVEAHMTGRPIFDKRDVAISIVIILVVLALFGMRHARADMYVNTPTGDYTIGNFTPFGPAKIIKVPPDLSVEAQERERQWMLACDPTFRTGKYGVEYYVFKKEGCEYGQINGKDK